MYFLIVSMSMKLHGKRCSVLTRNISVLWDSNIIKYHERVTLSDEVITELEAGLEVGKLLQLHPDCAFTHGYLTDFLAKYGDKTLRTFLQLT